MSETGSLDYILISCRECSFTFPVNKNRYVCPYCGWKIRND